MRMPATYQARFAVVRLLEEKGPVVARFDGGEAGSITLPSEVTDRPDFVVQTFREWDEAKAAGPEITEENPEGLDQSELSDEQTEVLAQIY